MVDLSEFTDLDVDELHLVKSPANGMPPVLAKSVMDELDAAVKSEENGVTPDPKSPFTQSAEADAIENTLTKEEAEEIENLLTKARFGGFCGTDECEVCKEQFGPLYGQLLTKAKLDTAARHALPKSAFAIPEKAPESGSYPIHDISHARNALARASGKSVESRVRSAVHERFPQIDMGEGPKKTKKGKAKKSPGVPSFSIEVPSEGGHLGNGQSGLAGPMTTGVRADHNDPSFAPGGESSYIIPEEKKVHTNPMAPPPMDRPGGQEGSTVASASKETWDIEVVEKENWVMLDDPASTASSTPGDEAWEDYDASTLDSVATALSSAKRAIGQIRDREVIEAMSGDPKDWLDAGMLADAGSHVCWALQMVASLAYQEAAEGSATKTVLGVLNDRLAKTIGEKNETQTAGNGAETSKEGSNMATVTKEELDAHIAEEAAKQAKKLAKKAAKKMNKKMNKMPAKIVTAMAKNANNGGDITASEMANKVNGQNPSNDVNAVGGTVESRFVNKGGKAKKGKGGNKALVKQLGELSELVSKMATSPRSGGPVLDGQSRGAGFTPASEGRQIDGVAKGTDTELQRLEKGFEAATDPMARDQLSRELTLARLRAGHEAGVI